MNFTKTLEIQASWMQNGWHKVFLYGLIRSPALSLVNKLIIDLGALFLRGRQKIKVTQSAISCSIKKRFQTDTHWKMSRELPLINLLHSRHVDLSSRKTTGVTKDISNRSGPFKCPKMPANYHAQCHVRRTGKRKWNATKMLLYQYAGSENSPERTCMK